MLARPNICSATNKDAITSSRCVAFWEMCKFNSGSWSISAVIGGLAYLTVLQDYNWDYTYQPNADDWIQIALFPAPAVLLVVFSVVVPIILNPYILGWPFLRQKKKPKKREPSQRPKKDMLGREVVGLKTFIDTTTQLDKEIDRAQRKEDIEIGSLATKDLRSGSSPEFSPKSIDNLKSLKRYKEAELRAQSRGRSERPDYMMNSIPEDSKRASASRKPTSSSGHNRGSRHSSRRTGNIEEV